MTTVDQRTGRRQRPRTAEDPGRTYRRVDGGGVAFGIFAAVPVPGVVRRRRHGPPHPEVVALLDNGGLPAPAATLGPPDPGGRHDQQATPGRSPSRRLTPHRRPGGGHHPAALADGDDPVRRGSCSGSTDWKIKVGPEDGRLEVEAEVDSNRSGQTWRWRLVHDGSVSASGTRSTVDQRVLRGMP